MTICQLVLDDASWKVTNSDGTITENYNDINRDKSDTFELTYKKRTLFRSKFSSFRLNINKKTLIHRLKSKGTSTVKASFDRKTRKTKSMPVIIKKRIRITALLQRNKDDTKNKQYSNYCFDPELSEIYYIFEDGTIQKRNDFGDKSPYLPLELFPEELEHLMKGA